MPQQLIYTSAPRGIVAGRSGYCTVARSTAMREALVLRLEQLSYYQHLSLGGAAEHPIFAHRVIDIRGARFHVLSRIQDAGLDFTGRTNFIAHHLAMAPEERGQFASPPVLLRDWNGWIKQWNGEPRLLENEDWAGLRALSAGTSLPARTWQQVTGDAVNGYGLLELAASAVLRVNGQSDAVVLGLLAESLELLEVRDVRHDWRSAAWQYTFTTSFQEQDNPADFRWRFAQGDVAPRASVSESLALAEVAASAWTDEEAALARGGRQPPRFIVEPQNAQVNDGESVRLQARAAAVPNPTYQWFKLDRENNREPLDGATTPELMLTNPPRGISRYALRLRNSAGEAMSRTAVLSVELASAAGDPASGAPKQPAESKERYQKPADQIDEQRQRLEAEEREKRRIKKLFWKQFAAIALPFAILAAAAIAVALQWLHSQTAAPQVDGSRPVDAVTTNLRAQTIPPTSPAPARQAPPPAAVPTNAKPQPLESPIAATDNTVKQNSNSLESKAMSRVESFNLPPGWVAMRVGVVARTNCEYLPDKSPRMLTVSSACEGFDQNGDNLLFVCHTNSQKEFTARLLSIESSSPGSRCGIMVRQTQATNSAFLFIGASSENLLVCLRDADGNFYATSTNKPAEPLWLKISEEDGRFAPSWSMSQKDRQPSSFSPDFSVRLKQRSLVGFAAASGNTSDFVEARFGLANQRY